MSYQPMTLARLGELLATCPANERWLMISEFLEEHRHEPRERRLELLADDLRRSTRDVGALFTPHGAVLAEAQKVADELELPRWWLNEQASAYVAPGGDPQAAVVFEHPGLRVQAASPPHLLAMKVLAGRRRDAEDIRRLAEHLNLTTAGEVLEVCRSVFPDEPPPDSSPGDGSDD